MRRNASAVAVAFVSAELALAGCSTVIPADESIQAMRLVGNAMPASLRETAEGGLAVTPTALELAAEVFGGAADAGQSAGCGQGGCAACGDYG